MHYLTIVPAYGRDYDSEREAIADWLNGKDFRICDISSRWDGSYCSIRDGIDARIRFNRLRDVTFYPPTGD